MKRKADMGLAILILLAVFAGYRLWEPEEVVDAPAPSVGERAAESGVENPSEDNRPAPAPETPPSAAKLLTPAQRITSLPALDESFMEEIERRLADTAALRAEALGGFVRKQLERALEGDLDAGLLAQEARSKCWTVTRWEDDLERSVANAQVRAERIRKDGAVFDQGDTDSPGRVFATEAENRAHLMRWYQACSDLQTMYERDFRERIRQMALDGHVIARYLYAFWPPPEGMGMDDFLAFQEWQSLAQQFSLQNLQEGEAAGMLAFAQASSSIDSFLPTRNVNNPRALAFYVAAQACGFRNQRVQATIDSLVLMSTSIPRGLPEQQEAEFQAVLALAEEIKSLCR